MGKIYIDGAEEKGLFILVRKCADSTIPASSKVVTETFESPTYGQKCKLTMVQILLSLSKCSNLAEKCDIFFPFDKSASN